MEKEIRLNILKHLLDEKYWKKEHIKYYSGHMYANSPYETSDSCNNCDGAKCDHCKLIEYDELECSIPTNELYDLLKKEGAPDDVASYYAYDDKSFYKIKMTGSDGNTYMFVFPNERYLKVEYPEVYAKIVNGEENEKS